MCRSKAEGGRRCPAGSRAAVTASATKVEAAPVSPAGRRKAARAEARARWDQAQRGLDAAEAALGPQVGNPSYLLTGPLARRAHHAGGGGDSSVFDDQVAEGRGMLISLLVSRGDNPGSAAAKADSLAAAWGTWSETPEA